MLQILRTNSSHPEFPRLIRLLDEELTLRNGEKNAFFAQYNTIKQIHHVVLLFEDTTAIACGAIKEYTSVCMEVKRMYTLPQHRGKGAASMVLTALEQGAKEVGYKKCILETGVKMPEALRVYKKTAITKYQITNSTQELNKVCVLKRIFRKYTTSFQRINTP